LCIEKVAARAGVGKATIYRRWPGKEDLLLDALASLRAPLPKPKGQSVRDDLVALLDAMRAESVDPRQARQFALLLGEGARYPRLIERYVEAVIEPRRDVFRAVLRRGVATREDERRDGCRHADRCRAREDKQAQSRAGRSHLRPARRR
jgi:AcrR family transcriptional regulator